MEPVAIAAKIREEGFCVVGGVIPDTEVETVRQRTLQVVAANDAAWQAKLQEMRARGHRAGSDGVAVVNQVLNHDQSSAPYLADRRIVETAEIFFGPWVRISCTDAVVNHPGNDRGYWHADWPYNQTNASNVRAPYPDVLMHLATIWMLTDFTSENGGTLVLPGSHRRDCNPSLGDIPGFDREAPDPAEVQAEGAAGSVLLYDSRQWHAVAPNQSVADRVALIVRYAPWWLNLNPAQIGSPEHAMMVVETGGKNYEMEPLLREVYEALPENLKPLYRHFVAD